MMNRSDLARFVGLGLAAALIAAVLIWARSGEHSPASAGELKVSYSRAVERAAPSVVNIYADRVIEQRPVAFVPDPQLRRFTGRAIFGRPRYLARSELGSGVIVSRDGLILTNNHVIQNAEDIRVALWDGRLAHAAVVGRDEETDLAVLKVELDGLPVARLADQEEVSVGDIVLAIGNPFGLGKTVTMGIVGATGRGDLKISQYEDFIQTDAAINQGNSGGALINSRGEIVGINTAMLDKENGAEGIGFAIPISLAMDVARQLLENGRVIRGWLGVEFAAPEQYPRIAAQAQGRPGVVISAVWPGGPADLAGIQPGDYLVEFDETPVTAMRPLLKSIAESAPGSEVPLRFMRGGRLIETRASLIQRPPRQRQSTSG